MTAKNSDLKFRIDTGSPVPFYEQIKQEIKLKILSGEFEADEKLPAIREYARELRVNQNTVVKVYYQLDTEGYLYSKPGQGYFVSGADLKNPGNASELLKNLTEEYIRKVTDIGFSLNEAVDAIKKMKTEKK